MSNKRQRTGDRAPIALGDTRLFPVFELPKVMEQFVIATKPSPELLQKSGFGRTRGEVHRDTTGGNNYRRFFFRLSSGSAYVTPPEMIIAWYDRHASYRPTKRQRSNRMTGLVYGDQDVSPSYIVYINHGKKGTGDDQVELRIREHG